MRILKFLFLIFLLSVFYQQWVLGSNTADSLRLALLNLGHDSLRVQTLQEIIGFYKKASPDSALVYDQKLLVLLDELYQNADTDILRKKYLLLKANTLMQTGTFHYYKGEYLFSIDFYQRAIEVFKELGNKKMVCDTYINLGNVYLFQGDYKKALDQFAGTIAVYEEIGDKRGISDCYQSIGLVHYYQKNYEKALDNFLISLKLYEEIGDKMRISNCYNNLGITVYELKQYDEAIQYYQKSLDIEKELGRDINMSIFYNNIGNVYRVQGKYKKTIEMYTESLKIKELLGDKNGITSTKVNIASLNSILADSVAKSESERIAYLNKAIDYGWQAYQMAKEIGAKQLENVASQELMNNYDKLGNYRKALEFAYIFMQTRDSLFSEEKTKAVEEMMVKYETERKEKEIQHQMLALEKARFRSIVLLSAIGFFILVISFLVYVIRLRQRAQKELAIKNRELQASNATKDKFFSIISHDLRSPLSGFRNLSSAIGQNFDSLTPDQLKENVIVLSKSSEETVNMLNNLLQWSKSQQNKIEVKRFPVRLHRFFYKMKEELNTKLREKELNLRIEIDESVEIEADENIVSTVVRNLLSNAIKFSHKGADIELGIEKQDGFVEIFVKDYGIGMTEDDKNKLFKIECDTKNIGSSPEKGSGIGLILCNELVRLHGGNILVESKIAEGSRFGFTIPLQ